MSKSRTYYEYNALVGFQKKGLLIHTNILTATTKTLINETC